MSATLYTGVSWVLNCSGATGSGTAGPAGQDGADGADGAAGANAYSITTGSFVQPATSANVTVSVNDSRWASVGQVVYVYGGGYYRVFSKPSTTSIVLTNLGTTGNAAVGATVGIGVNMSPAGEGNAGQGSVLYGTQAELDAATATGPAIWIITDSDPPNQIAVIVP